MTFAPLKLALVQMLLTFWATLHPGLDRAADAREIAEGVVDAVLEDAARPPIFSSHAEDAAAAAYWAFREAGLRARPPSGDRGLANGVWQFHVPAVELGNVRAQARRWFALLRTGKKYCPAHPEAMTWGACREPYVELGSKRMRRVRGGLARALGRRIDP